MKISTRGEYGLRALMEMGMDDGAALSLRDIAQRQQVSLDYLEQIVPALKSAGLIKSKRGAQGGYYLAKAAADITVYDALVALEGGFEPMICVGEDAGAKTAATAGCGASGSCAVQEVWQELQSAIEGVLKKPDFSRIIAAPGRTIRRANSHLPRTRNPAFGGFELRFQLSVRQLSGAQTRTFAATVNSHDNF